MLLKKMIYKGRCLTHALKQTHSRMTRVGQTKLLLEYKKKQRTKKMWSPALNQLFEKTPAPPYSLPAHAGKVCSEYKDRALQQHSRLSNRFTREPFLLVLFHGVDFWCDLEAQEKKYHTRISPVPHSFAQVQTQPDTAAGFFKALSERGQGHAGKYSSKHRDAHTFTSYTQPVVGGGGMCANVH